jgi:addiction module HigA family antidote
MEKAMEKYKGIHPGLILERELKKRNIRKGPFALSVQVYPQTLNEITKGRRVMTPELSLRIDDALKLEEGTMYLMQAYYEIDKVRLKINPSPHPDLNIIRKALFWDTDFQKIDWVKKYKAVIKRIFERGNDSEKAEALRFYGEAKVEAVTGKKSAKDNRLPILGHSNI